MFSLLHGFYEYIFSKPAFKVLMVGLDGAGKTTLLEHIKQLEGQRYLKPDKIPPTVGLNIGRIERTRAELVIWDVGGQQTLRKIWEKYYSEADCLVFVIDGADQIRLDEVRETIETMYHESDYLTQKPLLILENKCESTTFSTEDLQFLQTTKQGIKARTHSIQVSALDGTGVADALDWITNTLTSKQQLA